MAPRSAAAERHAAAAASARLQHALSIEAQLRLSRPRAGSMLVGARSTAAVAAPAVALAAGQAVAQARWGDVCTGHQQVQGGLLAEAGRVPLRLAWAYEAPERPADPCLPSFAPLSGALPSAPPGALSGGRPPSPAALCYAARPLPRHAPQRSRLGHSASAPGEVGALLSLPLGAKVEALEVGEELAVKQWFAEAEAPQLLASRTRRLLREIRRDGPFAPRAVGSANHSRPASAPESASAVRPRANTAPTAAQRPWSAACGRTAQQRGLVRQRSGCGREPLRRQLRPEKSPDLTLEHAAT